jgi:hypothetical protein
MERHMFDLSLKKKYIFFNQVNIYETLENGNNISNILDWQLGSNTKLS